MKKIDLLIGDLREDNFSIAKGQAKAILPHEIGADYYKWVKEGSRDYDTALVERIRQPIANGLLIVKNKDGTIKFDDRKVRYSGHSQENGRYTINVAPTHFGEMKSVDVPAMKDPNFAKEISEMGKKDSGDPGAYFSACFAVNAVPVSKEGYVHVFRRSESAEVYPGHWHVIGGMLDSDLEFFSKQNPSQAFKDDIIKTIRHEFREEAGVGGADFKLTGLVRKLPSTADFTYIAHVNSESREFLDGMSRAEDSSDHSDVMVFESTQKLHTFLNGKEKITPTGLGSLILYLNHLS